MHSHLNCLNKNIPVFLKLKDEEKNRNNFIVLGLKTLNHLCEPEKHKNDSEI